MKRRTMILTLACALAVPGIAFADKKSDGQAEVRKAASEALTTTPAAFSAPSTTQASSLFGRLRPVSVAPHHFMEQPPFVGQALSPADQPY